MTGQFDRLESLFRMMTPSTFVGAPATNTSRASMESNVIHQLMLILFETTAGGAYSVEGLMKKLGQLSVNGTQDQSNELRRVISILGPAGSFKPAQGMTWPYLAYDLKERKPVEVRSTIELFGKSIEDSQDILEKPYSIITINSPMISPQRRDAEKVEMFLNSIPGIVMSRCVPYVDIEFGFNRPGDGTSRTQLQTMGMLKFLLGASSTEFSKGSANKAMIDARRVFDPQTNTERSTAGMEMFTAPQTLINMDNVPAGNRYTEVLDPTRPFASLTSVTIDVKPTVGVYSYKKSIVQFKLHDRSRLSEIADLIRPQVYTQTTVWLTYGWRHPFEADNPYALFINNNMLRREAYSIQNASFAFDQLGQVDVTLELYTKGAPEIRTAKISQNLKEYSNKLNKIKMLAEEVNKYRTTLNLDAPRPVGIEIRSVILLDAAGRGSLPDFVVKGKKDDINAAIKTFENSLKKNAFDAKSAQGLIDSLKQMYGSGKTASAFAEVEKGLQSAIKKQFEEARTGLDPYLFFEEKDAKRQQETGLTSNHPMVRVMADKLNVKATQKNIQRQYASFAKIFSVFIANSILTIPGIDEVQACFYQFNSRAGQAAGINTAEFPIDLNVFEDSYKEEIELKGSDSFTIEEFLQLIIRSQIDDMRSVAYGYATYFEPYSTKSKSPTLKKGQDEVYQAALDNIAGGLGPFQKPQLEVYMETVFALSDDVNGPIDLLSALNSATSEGSVNRDSDAVAKQYRRILRIHVYDKTLNPYESATKVLSDKKGNFVAVNDDWLQSNVLNDQKFLEGVKAQGVSLQDIVNRSEGQQSGGTGKFSNVEILNDKSNAPLSNRKIKDFVSRYVPSIVYGTNASTIVSANVATKQDPLLTAAQLTGLNKNKQNTMEPNGSGIGGLPLRVIPAQLSLTTMGCPLVNYSQFFFVDFSTGTSLDNVYGVTGLVHVITPGKFESQLTFGFYDAYGRFESASNALEELVALTKVPR